jgi:hypothetical protein
VTARRIAIAVEPRLLADALSVVLRRPDVEVVLLLDRSSPAPEPVYDLAIVMNDDPSPVAAAVTVRLPMESADEPGSVTTVRGTEAAVVGDLGALLSTLRPFLG